MNSTFFIRLLRLTILLILQILVFNNIHLMGYATPLLIGYMLLCFERGSSRIGLLLWGFVIGIVFDVFSNTAGMASASCTLLAMMQPKLMQMFLPRDADEDYKPSLSSMGFWKYLLYAFLGMLILHATFYALDAFTINDWQLTLIAIGSSAALATLLCIATELFVRFK